MKFKISIISFITIFLLSFSLNAYALEQYYEISDIKDIKNITTSGDTANLKVFNTPITITKLKLLSPTGAVLQVPAYDIIYVFEDNTEKVVLQNNGTNDFKLTATGQVYSTSTKNVKTIKVKKTGSTDSNPLRGKLLIYYDDGNVIQHDYKTINVKNLSVTSSVGSNITEEYIPIGATCKISQLDFSNLTSSKASNRANIYFYNFDGKNYQAITSVEVTFVDGVFSSVKPNTLLKDYDVSHVKLGVNQYSPVYSTTFNGSFKIYSEDFRPVTPEIPEVPKEKFVLLSTSKDFDNNIYKFIFSKKFTVNAEDIEFKDSKGNAVAFTHSVSNNELIISPTSKLENGTYNIKVKKVTSTEGEELTNITTTLTIKSNFYVTNKDFSNFISTDTKELNLAFNKNLVVNTITMGDLTVTKTVDGNKLKINLPALAEETNYPLSIKVTSTDNEKLELNYNLSTKSITGNKDLDKILYPVLQLFEIAKVNGKVILIIAIGVGVIFITAMWLWRKAKSWLKSV